MIKKLFHGSEKEIKQPIFGYGKKYNDYGLGFYCTDELELAKEWAVDQNRDGFANAYEIELDGLSVLNLNDEKYCILHWLAILLVNREFSAQSPLASEAKDYLLKHFLIDYQKYDVIVGYRADDSYFSFAQDFINGVISYRQLANAMRLGNLGLQFVLKTNAAFARIRFVYSERADHSEWFKKKKQRDRNARRDYFDSERNKRQRGDLYITQIIDEGITADDSRLR